MEEIQMEKEEKVMGRDEFTQQQMIIAFEYGYNEYKKGNDFSTAKNNFLKDLLWKHSANIA